MIKTYASYTQIADPHELEGHLAIVIDVLRATSTMLTALHNKAAYIYPVATVTDAMNLKRYHTEALLCGERGMDKIEGFDYSNSPYDYALHHVKDRQLIFTTTNGTRAIHSCDSAAVTTIAALLNAEAIIKYCREMDMPIAIVMAGTDGRFSIDDGICAGAICYGLERNQRCDDLGKICSDIFFENHERKTYYTALMESNHAKAMARNGLVDDIKYCSQYSIYDIIPKYNEGVLTK